MSCPLCGRGPRGTQAHPRYVRRLTCWSCGAAFEQSGPGRSRVVCSNPACARKRKHHTRSHPPTYREELDA